MSSQTVQSLEEAIHQLTPAERDDLFARFESPIDSRIEADLAAGRLDWLIEEALEAEEQGRTTSL